MSPRITRSSARQAANQAGSSSSTPAAAASPAAPTLNSGAAAPVSRKRKTREPSSPPTPVQPPSSSRRSKRQKVAAPAPPPPALVSLPAVSTRSRKGKAPATMSSPGCVSNTSHAPVWQLTRSHHRSGAGPANPSENLASASSSRKSSRGKKHVPSAQGGFLTHACTGSKAAPLTWCPQMPPR